MRHSLTLAILCLPSLVPGQEPEPADPMAARVARLKAVLTKMAQTKNTAFETTSKSTSPMSSTGRVTVAIGLGGAVAGRGRKTPDRSRARGVLVGGVLYHSCLSGQHERLASGRKRIARSKGGTWEAVTDTLVDGATPPFLLDPEAFLRLLTQQDFKLTKVAGDTLDNLPVEVYSLTFTGVTAHRLGLAGLYPKARSPYASITAGKLVFRGRGGVQPPEVGHVLDLVLYVDPTRGVLKRAVVNSYEFNPIASLLRARGLARGGAQGEEDAEDEDELPTEPQLDPTKLEYVQGLPKRKLRDMPKESFEVRFSAQGTAKLPGLDARARQLLGL